MIGAPSRQPALDPLVPSGGWDDGIVGLQQADSHLNTSADGTFTSPTNCLWTRLPARRTFGGIKCDCLDPPETAAVCNSLTLDTLALSQDCLGSAKVDVSRREVVDAPPVRARVQKARFFRVRRHRFFGCLFRTAVGASKPSQLVADPRKARSVRVESDLPNFKAPGERSGARTNGMERWTRFTSKNCRYA
jgi:hypothetical protein